MHNGLSSDAPGQPGDLREGPTTLLHIFPSFTYGGQQARLAALARGLGAEFSHHVVALDGELSARALFHDDIAVDFSACVLKKSSGIHFSNLAKLRQILNAVKPDILCTYNWGAIEAVMANRLGPKLPHVHFEDGFGSDEILGRQSRRRVLARRLLLGASVVVVPSHKLEDIALSQWKLKAARVQRIENGIDYERLRDGQRGHRSQVVIGSLGALRPEKNYHRLVDAFIGADLNDTARLEIIGDGPERLALVAYAGDDARVKFPGATSLPENAYAQFDVFALSSDTEQAPLSLMEAMAAGLPIVATNVGDIADMVAPENQAYITPLGDDEAFSHALIQMVQNPSARAEIGAANRRKAKEAFSLERMTQCHRSLYYSLVGEHG